MAQNDTVIETANAGVQTHLSQASDNVNARELEVHIASAALNLTDDDALSQGKADFDCDSDSGFDDVDDTLLLQLTLG